MRGRKRLVLDFNLRNLVLAMGIVISTALSITSSVLLGRFVDFLLGTTAFDQQVSLYLITILGALFITVVANIFLAQYLPLKLQLKKSIDYSQRVMKGVLKISQGNFQGREKGYYINLVTSSAFTCGDIYGQINVELIGNMLCVLLMLAVVSYISPYLGLLYFLYIPLFALFTQRPNKKLADFQKSGLPTQDAFLSETKKIIEDKRGINIVRAEEYYEHLYKERSDRYLTFATKFRWYSIISTNIPTLLSAVLTTGMLGIIASLYYNDEATIGSIFVVFQLSQLLQGPLNRCLEILIYRTINDAHISRIYEFEDQQHGTSGFEDKYHGQDDLARISSAKVFSSPDKQRLLFSVNKVVFPKKKLIVIKGENGCGKSTLANLLTGFTDINIFEGNMELDNSLSNAAYFCHPILFTKGTIEENMFGQQVNSAALNALNISFRDKCIDESGGNLSLGEQQKVGLLRTFSSKSNTVILDEPFTNLDQESIRHLVDYIAMVKREKSIIAIVHSPELDQIADIVVRIGGKHLVCIDNKSI